MQVVDDYDSFSIINAFVLRIIQYNLGHQHENCSKYTCCLSHYFLMPLFNQIRDVNYRALVTVISIGNESHILAIIFKGDHLPEEG